MEQLVKIPTPDNKIIYGRLRGDLSWPLVVFVHGLGGLMDQHIYYNAARFMEKHRLATFRFNLYDQKSDTRNLSDCTLATHSSDLDTVTGYFRNMGVKHIVAVGHSFGAPAILLSSKQDFNIVILWDPSYGVPKSFQNATYIKEVDMYQCRWNFDVLISKRMYEEGQTLKTKEEAAIRKLAAPVKIISAGNGFLIEGGKRYYELANKPKAYVIIEGAGHTFDEEGVEEKVFQETLDWIEQYIFHPPNV